MTKRELTDTHISRPALLSSAAAHRFWQLLLIAIPLGALNACATSISGATRSPRAVAAAEDAMRAAIADEVSLGAVTMNAVAVTPLRAPPGDTILGPLAFGLAELIALDLSEVKAITVVDRLRLDALLRELKLAEFGRVDSTTAPRMGRLLGARRIIVGSLSETQAGNLGITARIADVTSGQIAGGLDANISLARLFEAQKALVFRLLDELGITPSPRERERILQRQTADLRALLAFSRGVQARVIGDLDVARNSFRDATRLAPAFEAARTTLKEVELPASNEDAVSRVTKLSAAAVNPPGPSRVVEAVDAPLSALRQTIEFLITVRIP